MEVITRILMLPMLTTLGKVMHVCIIQRRVNINYA